MGGSAPGRTISPQILSVGALCLENGELIGDRYYSVAHLRVWLTRTLRGGRIILHVIFLIPTTPRFSPLRREKGGGGLELIGLYAGELCRFPKERKSKTKNIHF